MAFETGIAIVIDARGARTGAREVEAALGSVRTAAARTVGEFDKLKRSIFNFRNVIAAAGIGLLARDIVQASLSMQRIQFAMQAATGSVTAAGKEIQFLRQESQRLGLNFESTAQAFTRFIAATNGTALAGDKAHKIFTSFATAARVLGLEATDVQGIFRALEQIVSKGTVSMEELRLQLGDRLPRVMRLAADSMGLTVLEFQKMVAAGDVMAEDFLPRFAREVEKTFGSGTQAAVAGTQAKIELLRNAIFDMKVAFGEGAFIGPFTDAVIALTNSLKGGTLKVAVEALGEGFKFLANNIRDVGIVLGALALVKLIPLIRTLIPLMHSLAIASAAVMATNPIGWTLFVGSLAVAIVNGGALSRTFAGLIHQSDSMADAVKKVTAEVENYTKATDEATRATGTLMLAQINEQIAALRIVEANAATRAVALEATPGKGSANMVGILERQREAALESINALEMLAIQLDDQIRLRGRLAGATDDAVDSVTAGVGKLSAAETALSQKVKEILANVAAQRREYELSFQAILALPTEVDRVRSQSLRNDVTARVDAANKARELLNDVEKQRITEQQRLNEEAARLSLEPWLNAARGIQDAFADTFTDIFERGIKSFGDLADRIKSVMFRLAGEIASALVFRPVVGSVLGGLGLNSVASAVGAGNGGIGIPGIPSFGNLGIGSFIDKIGQTFGFGGPVSGINATGFTPPIGAGGPFASAGGLGVSLSSIFGAAGIGAFGGGILADLLGLNSGTGSIGGGLGAGLGFAVGGPIGGILGGLLGSIGGGFLGGKPGKPSFGGNLTFKNGTPGFDTLTGDKGLSGDDAQKFGQAIADAFLGVVQGLGGSLGGSLGPTNFGFTEGKGFVIGDHGVFFDTAEEAAAQAVSDMLSEAVKKGALKGIDPQVLKVLKNSMDKGLEQALSDAQFAAALFAKPVKVFETTAKALNQTFIDMGLRAHELGLPLGRVIKLFKTAREQFVAAAKADIAARVGPLRAVASSLNVAREGFLTDPVLTDTNPEGRLTRARGILTRVARDAKGGDVDAAQRLPQLARDFLEASRAFNASSSAFGQDFRSVQKILGGTADIFDTEADRIENKLTKQLDVLLDSKGLLDAIRREIKAQRQGEAKQLDDVKTELKAVNDNLDRLNNRLRRGVNGGK